MGATYMKKTAFFALSMLFCLRVFGAEQEVRFAIGEWAPFTGSNIVNFGAASEVVSAAAKAGGLKPVYVFVPWKRAEDIVSTGKVFATFPYRKTPEREEKYNFSDAIFNSAAGILRYSRNVKTKINYKTINDLQPYVVGCTAGSEATINPLKVAKIRVEETTTFDTTLMKLASSRIDFAIEDKVVAFDAVKRIFPEKINDFEFLENDFTPANSMHVMVSKRHPGSDETLKKFNVGLKKIKDDGTMKKIFSKYGLTL